MLSLDGTLPKPGAQYGAERGWRSLRLRPIRHRPSWAARCGSISSVGVLVLGTFLCHADLVVRQLEQHQPLCGAETARHKRQGSVFLSLTAEASPAARPPASLDPTATVIAR